MGNAQSAGSSGAAGSGSSSGVKFTPSDGFFLMNSAKQGSVEVLRLFLKKDPALVFAHSSEDGSTAWHYASQEGHTEVLELMASVTRAAAVSNTFDPLSKVINTANAKGQTALMLACKGGHYACVRFLLSNGANPTAADAQGLNTLHYAALGNNPGCLLQLLKKAGLWGSNGPQPPAPSDAVLFKFVNGVDGFGRTPLHYASWSGVLEAVVALLSAGANILARSGYDCYDSSLPCNSGTTPMHLAAMRGHRQVVIAIMATYLKACSARQRQVQQQSQQGATDATAVLAPGQGAGQFLVLPPDPRSVQDAYSNTPHMIASTRQCDDTGLLQLLDPRTDIPSLDQLKRLEGEAGVQVLGMMRTGAREARQDGGAGAAGTAPGTRGGESESAAAATRDGGEESSGYVTDNGSCSDSPVSECSVNFIPAAERERMQKEAAAAAAAATARSSGDGAGPGGEANGVDHRQSNDGALGGARRKKAGRRRRRQRRRSGESSSVGSTDTYMLGEFYGFGAAAAPRPRQHHHHQSGEGEGESNGAGGAPHDMERVGERVREMREALHQAAEHHGHGEGEEGAAGGHDEAHRPSPGKLTTELGKTRVTGGTTGGGVGQGAAGTAGGAAGAGVGKSDAGGKLGAGVAVLAKGGASAAAVLQAVPDCFLCPLTLKVLRNPVTAADGVTYEEEAIAKHFAGGSDLSPLTHQRMPHDGCTLLFPNRSLKQAIEFWAAANNVDELLA